MTPWTFDVKFPHDNQFTFMSLMFAAGEDENIKMLPLGPAPERLAPVYGQAPYFLDISSKTGGACSGLNPYAGPYICTTKFVRGISVMMSILQPPAGASSSFSSVASPDQDPADDYLEIRGSTYEDFTEDGRLIVMVAPARGPSHDSSSRYPTITRSETSDAQTPNDGMI
jgi:hypothetical protein